MTAIALDGSPVEAFALLPPGPGPDLIAQATPDGGSVLELGCGAGRLLKPLSAKGYRCAGVDNSPDMLERVPPAIAAHLADIETCDLGERFDVAVLASFLVNTPDAAKRDAYLRAAARHAPTVVVQRLDPELIPGAVDAESEADGVLYEMRDVDTDGGMFRATMRFTIDSATYEHRYEGVVLDDGAIERAAARANLRVDRYLDGQRTWLLLKVILGGFARAVPRQTHPE